MNALIRGLIEKASYGNGWENVRESDAERVIVFSAPQKATAIISASSLGCGTRHVDFRMFHCLWSSSANIFLFCNHSTGAAILRISKMSFSRARAYWVRNS